MYALLIENPDLFNRETTSQIEIFEDRDEIAARVEFIKTNYPTKLITVIDTVNLNPDRFHLLEEAKTRYQELADQGFSDTVTFLNQPE